MSITKENKKDIISNVEKAVSDSGSLVFVNFHGLGVADSQNIRRKLREEGVEFYVARKTLINRALNSSSIKGDKPELVGELAVAYGKDLISPARGIYEFQKKLEGKVSIMGGIFEGSYKNKGEMLEIASIPSTDTLRGMFVNIINSPIQRFVIALDQIAIKKA